MTRIRHVAVVIPVGDGADTIEATIESVEHARRRLPAGVSSTCVIVVEASADAKGSIIERRPGADPEERRWTSQIVVRTAHGRASAARSVGCRVALGGSLHQARNVWLAHTDADTVVPRYWLTAQLELAERDVAAVAGSVELEGDADDTLHADFQAAYDVSPDEIHHPVHGANMGTRGDVYLLAGGWGRLESGEDREFWMRLDAVATCVSSSTITVRKNPRMRSDVGCEIVTPGV